ncbi:hypothetical protein L3073_13970 [Ancylomarina sp. DW003]|nr:hypothetical protein [Ancylomarina sp. DW003]MDE5423322.1 hypothetical protein [Ancylomarina sp. DW003]
MKKLFDYIFYKACKLDEFISGDSADWTFFYGVIITTLFSTLGIYLIANVLLYFYYPNYITVFESSFKYLIIIILLIILFYVRYKRRYIKILEKCTKMPKKEKRLYGTISLLYILFVIVGNLWISELIRDNNYMVGY